ncbi:Cu(I)-responsive transcriptional regulator [Hypericibacter sp.]|uniref:Cu(I)-responsive transcriptional regulator n=1 Tax=Hypericibacter sp. TaxID=2705401 RepID=UPI003D6D5714
MKTIGEAAKQSGISAKMIRHYDAIGLVRPSARSEAGYRHYTDSDVHTLSFVRRARHLGFSLDQTAKLLQLWRDRQRASAEVKSLALRHIEELDEKIAELEAMRRTLDHLARHCHGDHRPDCPIIDDLATKP